MVPMVDAHRSTSFDPRSYHVPYMYGFTVHAKYPLSLENVWLALAFLKSFSTDQNSLKKNSNSFEMSTEEKALSVVMARWGNEAVAERDALQIRLDELKKIYPIHFLTDADINNGETGAFQIRR